MSVSTFKMLFYAVECTVILFIVVSQCVIFKKAGSRWWHGLIPIYAETKLFDIAWQKRYVVFYIAGEAFFQFLTLLCQYTIDNPQNITGILNTTTLFGAIIILSIYYVITIQMSVQLAYRFGHSEGFGIGLTILPFIFFPILAFGPAEYKGNPFKELGAKTTKTELENRKAKSKPRKRTY